MRAAEAGVRIGDLRPGARNAITDIAGVRVGHTTLIAGSDVRTGVTVIEPHDGHIWREPLFAGCFRLNGNGELTGLEWIRESGLLTSPVAITNTHSLGVVRDALVAARARADRTPGHWFALPVVGETYDGRLNDINGFHVTADHVHEALASASDGDVAGGNVGGGTGMVCHGFKGGIGTSSRIADTAAGSFVVGVLVQANHGRRQRLRVNGVPVGERIGPDVVPLPGGPDGRGSIIVVVATDAPLLPTQCDRLAKRASLGVGRTGGSGDHFSGDLVLAFSTANRGASSPVEVFPQGEITPLFDAVIEATEDAIVDALVRAETMTGRGGLTAYALGAERLASVLGG